MKNWKIILISVVSVIAVIICSVFFVQGYQNKAYSLEEKVKKAYSDIEVQEKARVDSVHNLADCIMSYNSHEAKTLIALAEARGGSNLNSDTTNVSTIINAVAESYPELKSDVNYQKFMNELIIIENEIAAHRKNYNYSVEKYNNYVRQFPARSFLDLLGYEKQNYELLEFGAPETAPQNLFGE